VLPCDLKDKMERKRGVFNGVNVGEERPPKTFFDCGDQGCRIISDYIKDRIILFFSGNFDER